MTTTFSGKSTNTIEGPLNSWTKFTFNIDPKQLPKTTDFKINITGSIWEYNDFIALDDVVLTPGQCPTASQTLFFCKGSGDQYSSAQRCDYVYDCPQKD